MYIWIMKSFKTVLAIFSVFFMIAVSCPANATTTDESITIVDASFDDITLEVADFSTSADVNIKFNPLTKIKDFAVVPSGFTVKAFNGYIGYSNVFFRQVFTEIKRFPNPRDAVSYV